MLDSASLDLRVLTVTRRRQVFIDVPFGTDFSRINRDRPTCLALKYCSARDDSEQKIKWSLSNADYAKAILLSMRTKQWEGGSSW